MAGATVAVTGANGFIASWLVKLLLERGYNVRGAVRDPVRGESDAVGGDGGNHADVTKVGHLLKLPGAKERLVLSKTNLLQEGSFDRIFYGVDGVFHTASPVPSTTPSDIQKELLEPAVKGTRNVLESASKTGSVRRVVLTSSIAAVTASKAGSSCRDPNIIIDESWWSDPEWCKNDQSWYGLSKTQAEQAAWDFAKEKGVDLVVMNPGTVFGPVLQDSINASSKIILGYLNGSKNEIPNRLLGVVHVKDVAMAHVLAFEKPAAEGRYLLVEKAVHAKRVAELLRVLCPKCAIPDKYDDNDEPLAATYCSDKIRNLGLVFTPAEEAIRDCVESLKVGDIQHIRELGNRFLVEVTSSSVSMTKWWENFSHSCSQHD